MIQLVYIAIDAQLVDIRPKVTERGKLQDSLVHLSHSDEHNNSEARAVRSLARVLVADTCCLWSCPSTKQLEVKQSTDQMKFILNNLSPLCSGSMR